MGGGVLGKLRFELRKEIYSFSLGGFWVRSDLDSGNNFNFGRGGVFWNQILGQGCSGEFGQKFLET